MRLQSKVGTGAFVLLAAIAILAAAVYRLGRATGPGPGPQAAPVSPNIRPSGGVALPHHYSANAARIPDKPGVVTTYRFHRTR